MLDQYLKKIKDDIMVLFLNNFPVKLFPDLGLGDAESNNSDCVLFWSPEWIFYDHGHDHNIFLLLDLE